MSFSSTAIALIVGTALGSSLAHAESIRGFISIRKTPSHLGTLTNEVMIRPINERHIVAAPLPVEATILDRATLSTLNQDDFIVVTGDLKDQNRDGRPESITLHGIESVGLKSVIGSWRSPQWEVVRFENFNRISLYRPIVNFGGGRLKLSKYKDLNYTLAPDRDSRYAIFMVETSVSEGITPVFIGQLEVKSEQLRLEIFDPKTGKATEAYSLSPL